MLRRKIKDAPIRLVDGDRSAKYPKRSEFVPEGVVFLNAESINNGYVNLAAANFLSEQKYAAVTKGRIQPNDIVMTTRGNGTGDVAFVGGNLSRGLINAQMLILRADAKELDPRFLYYFLRSPSFVSSMRSFRSGSAQPQLPMFALREMEIEYPQDPEVQRRIASILSAYDDLIENNTRRIKIFEEAAQRLYREWFVNFRFPGHENVRMVDSEVGPIPEEWHVVSFDALCHVLSGGTPKTTEAEYWGGSIPFFGPTDAPNSFYALATSRHITELGLSKCNSKLYAAETVFITARGTVGKVVLPHCSMAMNQSCYALKAKRGINQLALFLLTRQCAEQLRKKAHGAVFDTITVETFQKLRVPRPPEQLFVELERMARPLFALMLNLQKRNSNLHATRDLLLPKLISGEIPIDAAEKIAD